MEHGSATFIDSQNRANTFVNYAAAREWKTSSSSRGGEKGGKIERNENMMWHRSHRSVGRKMGERSRPLRDWFCGRTSVVFRRYAENTSIDGCIHRRRPIRLCARERRNANMRGTATRVARMCHGKPALIFHVCAITHDPFRAGRSSN